MTPPGTPPHAEPAPVDTVARQLITGLLTGLALVLFLRGALGASSTGWLFLWLVGGVVVTVVIARLLETSGVPRPFGMSLTTAGVFAVLTIAGLILLALIGDPGSDNELSLLVGLPAAAFATVVAIALLGLRRDDEIVTVVTLGGFFIAFAASNFVGDLVREARDDAEQIRVFTEAGLTPYAPEIEDLETRFSGSTEATPEEGGPPYVKGYGLFYEVELPEDQFNAASVTVEVMLSDNTPACDDTLDDYVCREGDGYVIEERDGEVRQVVAEVGGSRLVATFQEGEGELPSPEEVGQALADAEEVEWEDVVGLDDRYEDVD